MAETDSKSAITPLRIGRMTSMPVGVRPSISFAARPTALTRRVPVWSRATATTVGSFTTTSAPRAKIRVLDVPRSIARSLDSSPLNQLSMMGRARLRM